MSEPTPDLTLAEALDQYPDECLEVLCRQLDTPARLDMRIHYLRWSNNECDRQELVGACLVWLAGKQQQQAPPTGPEFRVRSDRHWRVIWPQQPLRFYLAEVRAHMKGGAEWLYEQQPRTTTTTNNAEGQHHE